MGSFDIMRIKNWEEFQHFKDRNPIWIKLYRKLLDDKQWHDLDPQSAKVLIMLWLLASEHNGVLPNVEEISFRLRMPEKVILSTVSKLSHWLLHSDINLISSCHQDVISETETETEKISPLPSLPEGTRERGKTAFPDGWKPEQGEMEQWRGHGLADVWVEFATFRDHAKSNDRRCKDWPAAWRNWCRKALRMKEERANGLYKMRV